MKIANGLRAHRRSRHAVGPALLAIGFAWCTLPGQVAADVVIPLQSTKPGSMEMLGSRLASLGWRVGRADDGSLLLTPGVGGAAVEHKALVVKSESAPVFGTLAAHLSPHGWRVEQDWKAA